jgi:hypothetical protein
MPNNSFGRLPFVILEERTGKAIIVKKTGTILILSENKVSKIKKGKIVKERATTGKMNYRFNTPCTLAHDTVYYVSQCVPYKFSLRTCSYESLD